MVVEFEKYIKENVKLSYGDLELMLSVAGEKRSAENSCSCRKERYAAIKYLYAKACCVLTAPAKMGANT
jgi:hypothetical protein